MDEGGSDTSRHFLKEFGAIFPIRLDSFDVHDLVLRTNFCSHSPYHGIGNTENIELLL